jgi:hypothetical protein
MLAIALVVLGIGAAGADAKTVDQGASGSELPLVTGQSLTVNLKPPNSGSTGFHWRFAQRPAKSVLRLTSNRRIGTHQRFRFKARRGGVANFKLQYVPPARHARAVKTFRLTVVVNAPEPKLDCTASGASGSSTVATSGLARVFKVRRTVWVSFGGAPVREGYDAYYGCATPEGRAFRLGNIVSLTNPLEFWNITLRGTKVGFVFLPRCPFNNGCENNPPYVVSQDLVSGKVIRAVGVGACGPGCPNSVSGLVLSATGGLAWIEQSPFDGVTHNQVHRSDAPAPPGETVATDSEVLDPDDTGVVDPDSLEPDSTEVTWLHGGTLQRAPLR